MPVIDQIRHSMNYTVINAGKWFIAMAWLVSGGVVASDRPNAILLMAAEEVRREDAQYSPMVGQTWPDNVYWGDTHVHTSYSSDAFVGGARVTPDEAYRFAKGETIRGNSGEPVRLNRPLDFLMVSDHAENLGVLTRLAGYDGNVPDTEDGRRWAKVLNEIPRVEDMYKVDTQEAFVEMQQGRYGATGARHANYELDERFKQLVWDDVIDSAERHNEPGRFTAFIGYEWSATAPVPGGKGAMVHRNVLYEGGADQASQVLPYSRFHSDDPEDLWRYLEDYETLTGGRVLAIPHNTNLSGGNMFKLSTVSGKPFTAEYARTRSRWEPVVEVTQIKGDGETHPLVSPDDEFADFEETYPADLNSANSFARPALKRGLAQQAELGVNPFKFGMIGSTDTHSGISTARENNFLGAGGMNEPGPFRALGGRNSNAAGYVAVWAGENTRTSLFDGMRRREVYASTGPRMTLRFFGGWAFTADDAFAPDLARVGYTGGVPMGGDLTFAPKGKAPSFLIRAVKDPDSANLDRVQMVKGWLDGDGELHEKIYNVALSDNRRVDRRGNAKPVGNTVDVENATYINSIGDPELSVVWTDPDFDKGELAFYYLRVLEIPTPRWPAYDAKFFDLDLPDDAEMVTQERAYSSPIWYTPAGIAADDRPIHDDYR